MASCLTLIRVRVPDRPGALGLVASRIGALKGDIVGIEVLDRDGGVAVDELAVVLPSAELITAVRREIEEVDGVTAEAVNVVDALPEPRLDALRAATNLCRASSTNQLFEALATELAHALRADWCAVVDSERIVAGTSGTPAAGTLGAAIHLQVIGELGGTLAIGREREVRAGEQLLITAMCELAATLVAPKVSVAEVSTEHQPRESGLKSILRRWGASIAIALILVPVVLIQSWKTYLNQRPIGSEGVGYFLDSSGHRRAPQLL